MSTYNQRRQQVQNLLSGLSYKERSAVEMQILQLLHQTHSLRPHIDNYMFNDGTQQQLFKLKGTVPIQYRSNQYNIPVEFWLPLNFPSHCPICYVTPVPGMKIKQKHMHVDSQGLIYHPYLHSWKSPQSNLVELTGLLCSVFGKDPPLYASKQKGPQYIVKRGILFHQRNVFNENQIQSIIHHFDDLSKAPKLLFGDKVADKFRNGNQTRKYNRNVLAEHDRTFGYGIPVFWPMRPSLQRFKTMMDEQFEPLRQHLLSGYHVVIQEGKPRADYSRNGKRVILHNLGVNSLPFAYVQYIQHKIDELHNFVRFDRNVFEYNPKYMYMTPNKHISHGTDNRHEREQNTPNRCIDCGRKDFGKIYDGDGLFYCNRCWMYYDMKVDEHHKGNSGYKAYNKQPQLKCPHGSLKKGVY
eukprot:296022_1